MGERLVAPEVQPAGWEQPPLPGALLLARWPGGPGSPSPFPAVRALPWPVSGACWLLSWWLRLCLWLALAVPAFHFHGHCACCGLSVGALTLVVFGES